MFLVSRYVLILSLHPRHLVHFIRKVASGGVAFQARFGPPGVCPRCGGVETLEHRYFACLGNRRLHEADPFVAKLIRVTAYLARVGQAEGFSPQCLWFKGSSHSR